MELPAGLLDLLDRPSPCFVATVMADGSPQMTQTWVDADPSGRIRINTVEGYLKVRNMRRDPRVALNIADPADPSRYFAVRGRVVSISPDGGAEHIEQLAQKYTGGPYPWYGGRDQVRLIVLVEADRVHSPQG
ncbi:TIGR03618 family F420-dependent PPOX class oxidoreductase [Modestobacter sp. I12A-02628]|uniref:PPOX class F420-dependent oxidoreductase n=1 Tax=Goekera deserti TaxID=2497753 RepID=A0A7K3WDF9_9ACTN|nr:PPOX class F420-dependent oxidoreductase [Goekera deserti]MPQ98383.1 TIGR03618 family F420-dependent PPOX class oxidoreductase [Goekera deserti]NDI48210.1 TIGR03618 family F420-dependent PPOX class oxidoreductase [Goekera deserti]NEL53959.1 PPOX class F420-dependent oxidoreductase [Goekera deserti]